MFRLNSAMVQKEARAKRIRSEGATPSTAAKPSRAHVQITETCVPVRRNRKRRAFSNISPDAVRTTWF